MAGQEGATSDSTAQFKACSKCGAMKPLTAYGTQRVAGGRKILRAQCRECYNQNRRAHYSRPEVQSAKQAKRKAYEKRVDLSAKRKALRRTPEFKAREKIARDIYRAKPEVQRRIAATKAAHRARPEVKAQTLLVASRLRAERKGIAFGLSEQWVASRVLAGRCQLTDLAFDYGPAPNGWRYNPRSPSIDRIDSTGGYTEDNCRIVITAINNALSQYGDDHFEEVAAAFLRQRGYKVERP